MSTILLLVCYSGLECHIKSFAGGNFQLYLILISVLVPKENTVCCMAENVTWGWVKIISTILFNLCNRSN